MLLKDKILSDMKDAMKSRESKKLEAIRFLQSAIKYREIELRPEAISNDEVMGVIRKLVKQRKDSIEQFAAAGRQEMVDNETFELKILEAYLPQQMSAEQVTALAKDVIATLNASSPKDMGAVIKECMARSAGSADGRMLSETVKALLTKA